MLWGSHSNVGSINMPDDSGLRPCRPTPARARGRRARCGTGVNNIVHSSGVRSNRIVNRVPTPPGDTYGPYFALISLWVMNTTTLTRRPPTVRPRYGPCVLARIPRASVWMGPTDWTSPAIPERQVTTIGRPAAIRGGMALPVQRPGMAALGRGQRLHLARAQST